MYSRSVLGRHSQVLSTTLREVRCIVRCIVVASAEQAIAHLQPPRVSALVQSHTCKQ